MLRWNARLPLLAVAGTWAMLAGEPEGAGSGGGVNRSCIVPRPENRATARGIIRDQTGAVVGSAHISFTCGAIHRETQSASDGSYMLAVPAGNFGLQASHAGFETATQEIVASVNQTVIADYNLTLAQTVANVSVNASEGYLALNSYAATKDDSLILETPQAVSVVTQEQLQQRNVQTLNEALRYSPGVSVEQFGVDTRYDSFLIRGFGTDISGYFVDGLRFPGYLGQIDPYLAENVSILKGPSSVLYGQSAPGGLVNVTSKRPGTTSSREVQLDLGNFDRRQVKGDFTGLFDQNGQWRYRLTGLFRDSNSQVNYSPDNRWYFAPAITWAPGARTTITVLGFYDRDKSGWAQFLPAVGTVLPSPFGQIPRDFFSGIPGFDGVRRKQWSAGYIVDHRFNDTWAFYQSFRAYNVGYDGATAYGLGLIDGTSMLSRLPYSFRDTNTLYGVDSRLQGRLKTGFIQHKVLAGYDLSRYGDYPVGASGTTSGIDVLNPAYTAPIPALSPYLRQRQWQRQSGIYLQDQMRVAEHWTVLLSGREDFVKTLTRDLIGATTTEATNNRFSGRVGVSYSAPLGFAPYVSYSTSFLPVLGVNYYGQPYQPTTGQQWEAGVKWQPTGWNTLLTASLYNINQNKVQTVDPNQSLNQIQVGQVRSRGAELEAVANLHHGITLHSSYSYDSVKVTDTTVPSQLGRYLVSIPRQTASGFVEYALPHGPLAGLALGFGTRFVGVQAGSADNSLQLPSYTLFDSWAHYDWKYTSFGINATNLTDRKYVGVCNSLTYCNYGYSRRVIGSVAFRW